MAAGHGFSALASRCVQQPINPKTGLAFTTYERKCRPETTNGNKVNNKRLADGSAPVVGSGV